MDKAVEKKKIFKGSKIKRPNKGNKMKKKKTNKQVSSPSKEIDERFAAVLVDPRFKSMRKSENKVKIDSRFKGMFKEDRFKLKSSVDKRGKSIVHEANEHLKSYYDLSDDEDEDDEDEDDKETKDDLASAKTNKKKSSVPDARGQDSDELLSSSSDESSDDEEEELDHNWGELDKDVLRNENVSRRIAICNADWDRIKAVDLFVLVNSFKPESGTLESLKIYTSEFGKQRIAEEKVKGPAEITQVPVVEKSDDDDDESDDEDGLHHKEEDAETEYMTEQLRKYQLNRLKYYYAIAEFDSERTAAAIYDELDGLEYESSATTLDIRFVPEEMEFEDEPVQICTCLPDLSSYKAPLFITTALQQSKVRLTWDETDPKRKEKMEKAFLSKDESAMKDLEAYLASSGNETSESEEEDDDEDTYARGEKSSTVDKVEKYRQLLASIEEENEDDDDEPDIEITFDDENGNQQDSNASHSEQEVEKEQEEEEEEVSSNDEDEDEVVEEQPVKKPSKAKKGKNGGRKGEKRKLSEEMNDEEKNANSELGLLLMEEGEDKHHFDYLNYVKGEKGQKKRKKFKKTEKKNDEFEVDLEDPRFNKIYTSHLYNIDPSDPHFKKTDAMEKLLEKKVKSSSSKKFESTSSKSTTEQNDNKNDSSLVDSSLLGLVASVKASTKRFEAKKKVRN